MQKKKAERMKTIQNHEGKGQRGIIQQIATAITRLCGGGRSRQFSRVGFTGKVEKAGASYAVRGAPGDDVTEDGRDAPLLLDRKNGGAAHASLPVVLDSTSDVSTPASVATSFHAQSVHEGASADDALDPKPSDVQSMHQDGSTRVTSMHRTSTVAPALLRTRSSSDNPSDSATPSMQSRAWPQSNRDRNSEVSHRYLSSSSDSPSSTPQPLLPTRISGLQVDEDGLM